MRTITAEEDPANGIIYGDEDDSKSVDLADAQLVLKAALKIDQLSETAMKAADVDGNGNVDLGDAQLVLKRALKIIDAFPVEK